MHTQKFHEYDCKYNIFLTWHKHFQAVVKCRLHLIHFNKIILARIHFDCSQHFFGFNKNITSSTTNIQSLKYSLYSSKLFVKFYQYQANCNTHTHTLKNINLITTQH